MNWEPIAGIVITLLGALIALVWRLASLATRIQAAQEALRQDVTRVSSALDDVKKIPVIERDIAQVKDAVAKLSSEFPKMGSRVAVLEEKVLSQARFRARIESVVDTEEK